VDSIVERTSLLGTAKNLSFLACCDEDVKCYYATGIGVPENVLYHVAIRVETMNYVATVWYPFENGGMMANLALSVCWRSPYFLVT
jgi:hypothetical protein